MRRMETTAAVAARVGISENTLRRLAASGEIPGAVRLSGDRGPWRFPADWEPGTHTALVPRDEGRGDYREPRTARPADVMSGPGSLSNVARARRVADTLAAVHSRPAVALADVLFLVAENATRHQAGRDG